MRESPITKEDLEGKLKALLTEMRQKSVASFDPKMLAWLGLVPSWTRQLASDCKFPGLAELSKFLEETQAAGLCLQKKSTNSNLSAWYSAQVYIGGAPFLPLPRLKEALDAVLAVEEERSRAQMLTRLARYLPRTLLPDVLAAAQAIKNPVGRSTALIGLTPNLPEDQRSRNLTEALLTAQAITDKIDQAEVLLSLAFYLPEEWQFQVAQQVLIDVQRITPDSERSRILVRMANFLPAALQKEALSVTWMSIKDSGYRAEVLAALAEHLPTEMQAEVLREARTMVNAGMEQETYLRTLSVLAGALTQAKQVDYALEVAYEVEDEGARASVLASVAKVLVQVREQPRAMDVVKLAVQTALQVSVLTQRVGTLNSLIKSFIQAEEKNIAQVIAYLTLAMSVDIDANA